MTNPKYILGFKPKSFILAIISLIGMFLMVFAETTFQFILGLGCALYIACWVLFSDTQDGSILFWKWKLKNIKKMWD